MLSLPTAVLFVLKTGSVASLITNVKVLLPEISLTLSIMQYVAVGLGGASEWPGSRDGWKTEMGIIIDTSGSFVK